MENYLAAITGIHGVSSSLWLPISQSYSGNKLQAEGVIQDSCKQINHWFI